jgi:hypothetical protein
MSSLNGFIKRGPIRRYGFKYCYFSVYPDWSVEISFNGEILHVATRKGSVLLDGFPNKYGKIVYRQFRDPGVPCYNLLIQCPPSNAEAPSEFRIEVRRMDSTKVWCGQNGRPIDVTWQRNGDVYYLKFPNFHLWLDPFEGGKIIFEQVPTEFCPCLIAAALSWQEVANWYEGAS